MPHVPVGDIHEFDQDSSLLEVEVGPEVAWTYEVEMELFDEFGHLQSGNGFVTEDGAVLAFLDNETVNHSVGVIEADLYANSAQVALTREFVPFRTYLGTVLLEVRDNDEESQVIVHATLTPEETIEKNNRIAKTDPKNPGLAGENTVITERGVTHIRGS